MGDCIIPLRDLGSDIADVETSISNLPAAAGGGSLPEITTEALRTVLQALPQTPSMIGGPGPDATFPLALPVSANDWPRLQWNDWTGTFTAPTKVIFLITDNAPGGTDSRYNFIGTEDSDQAAAMAAEAALQGVIIQPILVALSDGSYNADALTTMTDYANATGGQLTQVPFSGEGTALSIISIISIIENCGDNPEPKQGRMTGGGSVFHENDNKNPRVTHGFTLHCDGGPNNLEVNWPGHRFHMELLTEAICTDDPEKDEQNPVAGFDTMTGRGLGRLNGVSGATIAFTFVDDGEPGKVSDTARMVISDSDGVVLEVEGTITKGNQQAHSEN
ncbi:MAG: hypothetical protein O2968_17395 [Acidobacteria bacterium]|nr:hypothetical protein [Acidobacteriota bacterium]